MLELKINVGSYDEFVTAVKAASPNTKDVFRDAHGFVACGNGKEVRIVPNLESRWVYDEFFHGVTKGFNGVISVPDDGDYGIPKAAPQVEETPVDGSETITETVTGSVVVTPEDVNPAKPS